MTVLVAVRPLFVGLDLGGSGVKAVRMRRGTNGATVLRADILPPVEGSNTEELPARLALGRELPANYLRYLERSIREAFEFGNTPLKLRVRKRTE